MLSTEKTVLTTIVLVPLMVGFFHAFGNLLEKYDAPSKILTPEFKSLAYLSTIGLLIYMS